jgi:hypothetical protein
MVSPEVKVESPLDNFKLPDSPTEAVPVLMRTFPDATLVFVPSASAEPTNKSPDLIVPLPEDNSTFPPTVLCDAPADIEI